MVKRQSILPKPSSIVLDPSVLIAQHAQLTGTHPVTVGANTVLHPGCKISSAFAPVVLGEGVVIYERARVGLGTGDNADADIRRSSGVVRSGEGSSIRSERTVLGNNVVVETGAVVEAYELGEGCVVEVGAVVGRGCIIGKVCCLCFLFQGFFR
jgi:dynactin-6